MASCTVVAVDIQRAMFYMVQYIGENQLIITFGFVSYWDGEQQDSNCHFNDSNNITAENRKHRINNTSTFVWNKHDQIPSQYSEQHDITNPRR